MGKNDNDDHEQHYGSITNEKTNQDFNGQKPDPDKDPLGRLNENPNENNINSQSDPSTKPSDDNGETSNYDNDPLARMNENPNHPKPNQDGDPLEKINHQIGEDDEKEYKETEVTSGDNIIPDGNPGKEDEDHAVDQDSNDNRDDMDGGERNTEDDDSDEDSNEGDDNEHPVDKGLNDGLGNEAANENDAAENYRNKAYYKSSDSDFYILK